MLGALEMITTNECIEFCNETYAQVVLHNEGLWIIALAFISILIYQILYLNAEKLIASTNITEEQLSSIMYSFTFFAFWLLAGFFVYRLWFVG